jgi:hypothetical protein
MDGRSWDLSRHFEFRSMARFHKLRTTFFFYRISNHLSFLVSHFSIDLRLHIAAILRTHHIIVKWNIIIELVQLKLRSPNDQPSSPPQPAPVSPPALHPSPLPLNYAAPHRLAQKRFLAREPRRWPCLFENVSPEALCWRIGCCVLSRKR